MAAKGEVGMPLLEDPNYNLLTRQKPLNTIKNNG